MQHAPELIVQHWLNTTEEFTLESLRGRVVMIEAFQMLCPGCVSHALPQAQEVANTFATDELVVLGLHTVFEHHSVQGTQEALKAFLHEYRLTFPVGIDTPSKEGPIPQTMAAYQLRGTPTTLLIGRNGELRASTFGRERDMALGAKIQALLQEPYNDPEPGESVEDSAGVTAACDDSGCPTPD